jgi:hypothetical protein
MIKDVDWVLWLGGMFAFCFGATYKSKIGVDNERLYCAIYMNTIGYQFITSTRFLTVEDLAQQRVTSQISRRSGASSPRIPSRLLQQP